MITEVRGNIKHLFYMEVSRLYPGYFALVMATGIISIASYLLEIIWLARALFLINKVAYVILWLLTLVRLVMYFPNFIADLIDHARGPGFFTIVAGTCIMGSQFVLLDRDFKIASLLWFTGIFLWLLLVYTFFTAVTVREPKPDLQAGLNGGWLLAVVATQSISVLGVLVTPDFVAWKEVFLFFTLAMFLIGCMLYIIIIPLIFYRLTFLRFSPQQFTPDYWIDMGAGAITTLAGAGFIRASANWSFLQEILPFIKGFTFLFWAIGTWWIPLLLTLWAWYHIYRHFPISYDPGYWGLVFPLGMYTASTFQFTHATGLVFLYRIPDNFIYIALFAWSVTFYGLISRFICKLVKK